MKRPGKKLRRLVAAMLVGPPLLWGLIFLMMPMDWARDRIVARIQSETGHDVKLGKVRLRILGGVRLSDLEIASKDSPVGPWLKVRTMVVDVSASDLLVGSIAPSHADLSGVSLRVHRNRAGRLEFEDLLQKASSTPAHGSGPSTSEDEPPMFTYSVDQSSLLVVDESTDTRLQFSEMEGEGSFDGEVATLDSMSGRLNGGSVEMAARIDTGHGRMAMEGQIRADDVALGVGMRSLAYAIPLLAQAGDETSAQGQLTCDFYAKTTGNRSEAILKNLTGRGTMQLDDLTLDNSRVMAEVGKYLPQINKARIGSLTGDFEIIKRRVQTQETVLTLGDIPVNLSGWSTFDGQVDYLIHCEDLSKKVHSLVERLPSEARELIEDLPVERLDNLIGLEVTGTIDRPEVKPREGSLFPKKGNPLAEPSRRSEDRARYRAAGKKFLDRVIR